MSAHPDVIIVGAGIVGLSLAVALADQGVRVKILDAANVGAGASGAATSYLEPRPGETPLRLLEQEAGRRWQNYAAELKIRSGIDPAYAGEGQIRVAVAQNAQKLEAELAAHEGMGSPVTRLSVQQVRQLEPELTSHLALAAHLPDVSWVDGGAVCEALAAIVVNGGHGIVENCQVESVEFRQDCVAVLTDNDVQHLGGKLVLCCGMGANSVAGLPQDVPQLRAVRGVNLVLQSPPVSHMIKHRLGNMVPRGNGLLVGTTYERGIEDLEVDGTVVETLLANAESILPNIRDWPLLGVMAGLRTKTPSGDLALGRSTHQPACYHSLGHAGSGFLRTPVIASEFADFIATNRPGKWTAPIMAIGG